MRAPRSPRSPRSFRLDRAAILCAFLTAATACASPASPAPASAGATTAASVAPSNASSAPSTSNGAGIQISDADRAALADPTSVRVAEHEARLEAAIAERSGLLAILGAEGVTWLAKDRSDALRKELDAHDVELTDREPSRLTSAVLAKTDEQSHAAAIAGVPVFGAMFTAMAFVSLGIEFNTGTANPGLPTTGTSTSQQTVGGHRISTTTTTTTMLASSGSTVTADVTLTQAVTTADAATGASLGSSSNRVHVHAMANACPDAAGIAPVKLDIEFTEDASGMAGGSAIEMRSHSETEGHANDAAILDKISDVVDMSYTATANGTSQRATAITGLAMPAGATQQIDDGDVPAAEAANARALIVTLTAMTAGVILTFAERKWQSGACVRVDATTAKARTLAPNKVITFTAKPVHVIEGTDLDKPIFATFSGEGTLAPVNTEERPPPVSYTYTAPSKKDRTGKALLKSTSNRGIGLIEIVFRTDVPGWFVDYAGNGSTIKGQHCGPEDGEWTIRGTYVRFGQKGTQKWVVSIDGAADPMTGPYTYTDDARQVVAGITIVTTGRASGVVTLTIDDEGLAHMHFDEKRHTYTSIAQVPGARPGKDQNAPLVDFDQAWEIDETCP